MPPPFANLGEFTSEPLPAELPIDIRASVPLLLEEEDVYLIFSLPGVVC